jgi:hypothetical protein
MKVSTGPQRDLSLLLAGVALVLAGALAWEWDQGMALKLHLQQLAKVPATPVPPQLVLPEFALPDPVAGFPELTARPLFLSGRRPSDSPNSGGNGAAAKGQFVLVGVLITPQLRSALLRDTQNGKTETVAMGAVVRGLTLGDVQPDRAVLRQGADSEELPLIVQMGSRTTPAAPLAPAPPGSQATAAPMPPATPPVPSQVQSPPSAPASAAAAKKPLP